MSNVRPISTDESNCAPPAPDVSEDAFLRVLRESVTIVEETDIPYVLMGGIGSATHGRPRWTHDVDLFVRPEDAKRTVEALGAAGYETEETYPDWLFKGFKDGVLVDIIFKSSGGIVLDDDMIDRALATEFKGVPVRVIPPEDLLVIKSIVHDEHMPRHWHDALGLIGGCSMDWDYVLRRAKRVGARRTLSLLVYAQSNDLIVPNGVIRELFEAIYAD